MIIVLRLDRIFCYHQQKPNLKIASNDISYKVLTWIQFHLIHRWHHFLISPQLVKTYEEFSLIAVLILELEGFNKKKTLKNKIPRHNFVKRQQGIMKTISNVFPKTKLHLSLVGVDRKQIYLTRLCSFIAYWQ